VKNLLLLLIASMLPACGSAALTGSLTLSVDGDDLPQALAGDVSIEWDDGVNWTQEVLCVSGGDLGSPTYGVRAYDRSIGGGLEFSLAIQAYDGPGDYERDEFQPTTAVQVDLADDDDDDDGDDDDSGAVDDDRGDDDDSAGDDDDSAGDDDDDDDEDEDERRGEAAWHFGTDSGGVCGITVDDDGTSGAVVCSNVPAFFDFEPVGFDVSLSATWSCSDLRGDDDAGDERGDDDEDDWFGRF